jgi:hypothetical protein
VISVFTIPVLPPSLRPRERTNEQEINGLGSFPWARLLAWLPLCSAAYAHDSGSLQDADRTIGAKCMFPRSECPIFPQRIGHYVHEKT